MFPSFLRIVFNLILRFNAYCVKRRIRIWIIFVKPRHKRYHFPMQICINKQRIEQVKETVFLGVVLDEHLSWKPHISQAARKISKSIGVINRARFFLPKPYLKTLYYCLVYPYLHCCIIVWGSRYKTNLRRLVSLQKRVIRIISKSTFDSHSDPIFKELELYTKTFRY